MTREEVNKRLDDGGWVPEHTTLLDWTDHAAFVRWDDKKSAPRWEIVNLEAGRRVASYGADQAGLEAFTVYTQPERDRYIYDRETDDNEQ